MALDIEYFNSEEFKEAFRKSVEEATWNKGLPKIYVLDGWIVEHWKDGTINKIKEVNK